ncbi:MAG TPA: hypothetical protein O0X32_00970 [Methanocorpusculum sp.]|nr:hypothetical protein [Methanocorpusculum sp.]
MKRGLVRIPPMLFATVSMGLHALDGMLFKTLDHCSNCGGKPKPYDTKVKQYATLSSPLGDRVITVKVRRFICHDCGKLLYADEPFYPNTRIGSAIVDLALSLSKTTNFSHAATVMGAMGIVINRGSVRKYAQSNLPIRPSNQLYGMTLPTTFVSLIGRGILTPSINPADILVASGYPSRYVASENGISTAKEYFKYKNRRLKQ